MGSMISRDFVVKYLEVYGEHVQPQRMGTRGRFPTPYRVPPPDFCYAVVAKKREQGRLVEVSTRMVYATTQQVEAALEASPVSQTLNTYLGLAPFGLGCHMSLFLPFFLLS
jgi:hypothetical protein